MVNSDDSTGPPPTGHFFDLCTLCGEEVDEGTSEAHNKSVQHQPAGARASSSPREFVGASRTRPGA